MVVLAAAIAAVEGNADYAQKHWETLTTWTDYRTGLIRQMVATMTLPDTLRTMPIFLIKAITGIASYGYTAVCWAKKTLLKVH